MSLEKIGMCEGDIKTNPRPQEFYRAGTAPLGFEIPGSTTDRQSITNMLWQYQIPAYGCVSCDLFCSFLSFCLSLL